MKIEKKPINNPINNPITKKNVSKNLKNISLHLKTNKDSKIKLEKPSAPISNQIDQNIISDIKEYTWDLNYNIRLIVTRN